MPSSLFLTRADKFAEDIGDAAAERQIRQYLRHEEYPGPIVTFVGAASRGKTTLFRKAADVETESPSVIQLAGAAVWKKPCHAMKVPDSSFTQAPLEAVKDILLCDAPAFDDAKSDSVLSSLLQMTDLAVMAVQVTQPAGAEEVAFVRGRLAGVPAVLVLTKCDQVDEDDFQEGLEAVLDNYADFPWLAVLLSDRDGRLREMTARGQSLICFESWWNADGQRHAEEAQQAHLKQLDRNWRELARRVLDDKDQRFSPMLQEAGQALSSSASVNEALRLQEEIWDRLNKLPEVATLYCRSRLSDLSMEVTHLTDEFTDSIKAGKELDTPQIEAKLLSVYQAWDQGAWQFVQDRMQPDVDKLYQAASRYDELVKAATRMETGQEMIRGTKRQEEVFADHMRFKSGFDLQGSLDVTMSDKLREVAVPTVSALGAGGLLLSVVGATVFAPFAPLVALVGAGVMAVGSGGAISQSNQQKRISQLKEAISRQSATHQHQLVRQIESDWREFCAQVRETAAVSKQRLAVLLMEQSPAQDEVLRKKHSDLTSNLAKVASLRRDLRWLVEHDTKASLIRSNTEGI